MDIDQMIAETFAELDTLEALRQNKPLHHTEAYAGYEITDEEDPRDWFRGL